jgi:Fur family ferric uptake transcriptional regulator
LILRIVIKMTTREDRRPRAEGVERHTGARAATAALVEAIAARGLKHSRQRTAIAETFFAMGGHVAIDELVARVRQEDPRVSVATVYRTMKLLAECGLAIARHFGDGQTRYEPAIRRHHHDHLICTSCGDIVEFESERIEELQDRVARRHGFEVEHHRLEIYGRCARCRGAAGKEPAA